MYTYTYGILTNPRGQPYILNHMVHQRLGPVQRSTISTSLESAANPKMQTEKPEIVDSTLHESSAPLACPDAGSRVQPQYNLNTKYVVCMPDCLRHPDSICRKQPVWMTLQKGNAPQQILCCAVHQPLLLLQCEQTVTSTVVDPIRGEMLQQCQP